MSTWVRGPSDNCWPTGACHVVALAVQELMEGGSLYKKLNLRMPSGQRVFSWRQR